MFHAFSKTLAAVGLVSVLLGARIRSSSAIGPLPSQSASPPKDSEHVSRLPSDTMNTTLAQHDANDDIDRFWHCGRSPKIMTITVNDLPTDTGSAEGWKNYFTVSSREKWKNTHITYSVFNYAHFPKDKVLATLRRALRKWSIAAPRLRFERVRDYARNANLRIRFVDGDFEGPNEYHSSVAAHAFFPDEAADRMLEIRQNNPWTMNKNKGFNLLIVATHEFGHALGIYHTDVKEAIMYPYVKFVNVRSCELHADDVAAIQSLYGGPTSQTRGGARPASSSSVSSGDDTRRTILTAGHPPKPHGRPRIPKGVKKFLSSVTRRLSNTRVRT